MQINVDKKKIREKLYFLHANKRAQSTAVDGPYRLPKSLKRNIIKSKFSQDSIQALSDHIGYFLGLLNCVKVTIATEGSENDYNQNEKVGLYKVADRYHKEIFLTKKIRFEFKHVLAILVHESIHNYLYHHRISQSPELENELLTDIAAAYLGLGHLLLAGYKPIKWTDVEMTLIVWTRYKEYYYNIGYVTLKTIRTAIVEATKLRGWGLKKILCTNLSIVDRIMIFFQLLPHLIETKKLEKEKKLAKKQAIQIKSLSIQADKLRTSYNRVCGLMQYISNNPNPPSITGEDGRKLVEVANEIAIGKTENKIESIMERILYLKKQSFIEEEDIKYLSEQMTQLTQAISNWHKLLANSGDTILNS